MKPSRLETMCRVTVVFFASLSLGDIVRPRQRSQARVRTGAARRFFGKKSTNDMALPHPQSRKDHDRDEDKSSSRCVVWNFVKWTVNITEDRNAKNEVDPAKNGTRDASIDDVGCIR
jgi:hypothetical protein